MKDSIFERVCKCIESASECSLSNLSVEMSLTDDLGMESLHIVTLQIELEDEFGIQFDPIEDDFFEIFCTVGSLYEAINRKVLL